MTRATQRTTAALLAWLTGLVGSSSCPGQPAAGSPSPAAAPELPGVPREFRGVWVATVANIDWPSRPGLPVEQLNAEMDAILDACRSLNLNAVVLQVRPACDAMYRSDLEPWSEFLTGKQGQPVAGAPADYDPLARWVRGAHERGLQLHAWFNPFRARHLKAASPDAPSHIGQRRPDLQVAYGQQRWLLPSSAEAREHSLRVIEDVVRRYDVDGVHIDDYFYPYPEGKAPFPDQPHYDAYLKECRAAGRATLPKGDWRRAHVDAFVHDLYARVKAIKPWVLVGVSPYGIWKPGVPAGVESFDAFENLAADARRWLNEGWMDYCVPQLYWAIAAPKQPFAPLLAWWQSQNTSSRHVWPGLNASRVGAVGTAEAGGKGWPAGEIAEQIKLSLNAHTGGYVLYSMVALRDPARGLPGVIRPLTALPALPPESPWLAAGAPPPGEPSVIHGLVMGGAAGGQGFVAFVRDPGPDSAWRYAILPSTGGPLPAAARGGEMWVVEVDRFGRLGAPARLVVGP